MKQIERNKNATFLLLKSDAPIILKDYFDNLCYELSFK